MAPWSVWGGRAQRMSRGVSRSFLLAAGPAAPRSGRHEAPSALETRVSTFSSASAGPQSCPRPSHPHLHKGTLGAGDVKSKERVFYSNCGGSFKSLKSKEHPIIFLRPISGRKAPVQVRGPGGQAVSPSTVEVFTGEREREAGAIAGRAVSPYFLLKCH